MQTVLRAPRGTALATASMEGGRHAGGGAQCLETAVGIVLVQRYAHAAGKAKHDVVRRAAVVPDEPEWLHRKVDPIGTLAVVQHLLIPSRVISDCHPSEGGAENK